MTQAGQDAGFPDKEAQGLRSPTNASVGKPTAATRSTGRCRSSYQRQASSVPKGVPYKFQFHVDGVRGVPLIAANPNPNGYINPVLEWDTNNPTDGIAWSTRNFGADNNLFGAVCGAFSIPARRAWWRPRPWSCASSSSSRRASNGRPSHRTSSQGPNAYRSRRIAVAWSDPTRSFSATMGAPCTWSTTARSSPTSNDAAILHRAEVGCDLDHHLRRPLNRVCPPGHRRRSPAPGSHRTWRADFPHQRSSAVASQHRECLQLPTRERPFRWGRSSRCPRLLALLPGTTVAHTGPRQRFPVSPAAQRPGARREGKAPPLSA